MINLLFLLNALVSLVIAIFLIYSFIKSKEKHPELEKVFFLLFLIGFIFLLYSIIFFLWLFRVNVYNSSDFLFIHSILISVESILFLLIVYRIRKNKKVFYLLFIYLIFLFSIFMGFNFPIFLLISSLMLLMILFILLISIPNFTRVSKFAIFYCSISLLFEVTLLFKNQQSPLMSLISNIFFFLFILFFVIDLKNISFYNDESSKRLRKSYYLFDFFRYFIFIVILTNFVFIGTIAIHESGHFFVSKIFTDCDLERIVYEGNLPHTEILCSESSDSLDVVIWGGILFPVFVAFLFFFGGGTFMKEISLLIIGFNIILSYQDFIDLSFSQTLSTFFSMFGGAIIILGILILAKSRTTEEEFIHLTGS